jgi:riboflavin synthase
MFSGIIEELGRVGETETADPGRLAIDALRLRDGAQVGDSIAVNGVCLTIARLTDSGFVADVMPETRVRTTLGGLKPGDAINLELSLALGERVGGHMVAGHVDAVGAVTALREDGNARWVTVDAPERLLDLIAEKGSVAIDGISLTVVDVFDSAFTVSLIPHTLAATTAGLWQVGTRVNLEVDLVARYVQRAVVTKAKRLAEI